MKPIPGTHLFAVPHWLRMLQCSIGGTPVIMLSLRKPKRSYCWSRLRQSTSTKFLGVSAAVSTSAKLFQPWLFKIINNETHHRFNSNQPNLHRFATGFGILGQFQESCRNNRRFEPNLQQPPWVSRAYSKRMLHLSVGSIKP